MHKSWQFPIREYTEHVPLLNERRALSVGALCLAGVAFTLEWESGTGELMVDYTWVQVGSIYMRASLWASLWFIIFH